MSDRRDKIPGARMPASSLPDEATGAIPAALVDQFFDRELDEGSREKFFSMLRGDMARCAEVAKTQRIITGLREPIDAPDLTAPIMARLARRRMFLPARLRQWVKAGRLAAAACILIGVLGIALVQRYAPGTLRLAPRPAPLTGVIQSSASELVGAMDSVKSSVAEPSAQGPGRAIPGAAGPHQRVLVLDLKPGQTSVKMMVPGASDPGSMLVRGGSGDRPRFVLESGRCIDRANSTAMAFGLQWPPRLSGLECEEVWKVAPESADAGESNTVERPEPAAAGSKKAH